MTRHHTRAAKMPFFERDGVQFHFRDQGEGLAFVFQHGLGSDITLTHALYTPPPGVRLIGFDARGHGESRPLGDPKHISFASFADDLAALLDHQNVPRAVVGGISMGAGIALNFALRYPDRVLGLVLARPAWLDRPLPENVRIFPHIAQYLLKYGAVEGLRRFRQTPEYECLFRESPDCAIVVENNFEHPRAEECVARLERIPHDAPCHDRNEWKSIRVPTLVLANRRDPIHPWELAESLTASIPGARLREITSKSVSFLRHAADIQRHVDEFLMEYSPQSTQRPQRHTGEDKRGEEEKDFDDLNGGALDERP
jgi:pimeloyl-ACP methyl ester carboxylesterase